MRYLRDNKLICFLMFAVIMTGGALTFVSQDVYDMQKSVAKKSRDLVSEQWELRALKAEWAYLTRPDRLEQLSGASAQSKVMASKLPTSSIQELAVEPASYIPTPAIKPGRSSIRNADVSAKKSNNKSSFSSLLDLIGGER